MCWSMEPGCRSVRKGKVKKMVVQLKKKWHLEMCGLWMQGNKEKKKKSDKNLFQRIFADRSGKGLFFAFSSHLSV